MASVEQSRILKKAAVTVTNTVNEAVDLLVSLLSLKDRAMIANMGAGDLINLHFSLGAQGF